MTSGDVWEVCIAWCNWLRWKMTAWFSMILFSFWKKNRCERVGCSLLGMGRKPFLKGITVHYIRFSLIILYVIEISIAKDDSMLRGMRICCLLQLALYVYSSTRLSDWIKPYHWCVCCLFNIYILLFCNICSGCHLKATVWMVFCWYIPVCQR